MPEKPLPWMESFSSRCTTSTLSQVWQAAVMAV